MVLLIAANELNLLISPIDISLMLIMQLQLDSRLTL